MPSEIHYNDGVAWRSITDPQYNDAGTLRDLTEVHYNDGGTWRQVFGSSVSAETLAWTSATPSGTYHSGPIEIAGVTFTADTNGNYAYNIQSPASGSGTPTSGSYRPGATGVDGVNYEIRITSGSVVGGGTKAAIGAGTDIAGTWQNLDVSRGIRLFNGAAGGTGTVLVTVEIREILTPANTSGVSTFTLSIDGTGI